MSSSVNALNDSTVNVATSGTTSNGTKIVPKSSTGGDMDKNSFLKILAAQLSNLDPTQNQDSSAYVSQMAQFASMEQMTNLNTTMSDSAYQQMVGKTVITNEKDDNGAYVQGSVTGVIKKSGGTYLNMLIDGKKEEISVANVIGTVQTTDTNTVSNSRAALNSDFLAASALAANKKNVVLAEVGTDGKTTLVKGTASGAYIDTVSSATVKIKVDVLDSDGNSTTKTYDYGDIVRAGDLTADEMNVQLPTTTTGTTTDIATSTSGTTTTDTATTTATTGA
ncbi:MAG: flagellar hook capping protein [Clostridium sp.]|uniref:flagellar hook capping FlgD N-terminal domain-containing protein n=1 Tax=Clostridium sp. TaxID=1506 RepID=UPI0025BC640B|nr:flagellar hook capping FlgD N-terminal domain-containing protein [Clostridium sp.]MCE5220750.1 flagellar hook capping protein [Clostridium sp.]